MSIKRTSHAVYDANYHVVWCPKYRRDVFKTEKIRGRADELLRDVAEAYDIEVQEMTVTSDHVHMLISFAPRWSISQIVRLLKGRTAQQLFRDFPELKQRLWGGELWADGYFARTVGDRMTEQIIRRYIQQHEKLEQGPAQLALKLR